MTGVVKVGNAGETPPEPPSAQKFRERHAVCPAGGPERSTLDTAKPTLLAASAKRVARGSLRVRTGVNEQSVVSVRLKRGGKAVKTFLADADGLNSMTVPKLKAGRYSIEVRAADLAGNQSKPRKVALTVT